MANNSVTTSCPVSHLASRSITDAQQGVHKNLLKVVQKHLNQPFQKPISAHTQAAFDEVNHCIKGRPLILDSCCGTAMSTRILAEENPDAWAIGVDRSASRPGKAYNVSLPENAIIVQAEVGDFWRLAQAAGWVLQKHRLFYPNPYPKSKHLKRRWHAHPAFPALLALGGEVELRTNWDVYAQEFCTALHFARPSANKQAGFEVLEPGTPMTLFEKKYSEAGQTLYRCRFGL